METARTEVYSFLKSQMLATISTASTVGKPWGAAIYFAVTNDLNFYFITHSGSRKYQNLKENSQAAITVTSDDKQITVQSSGEATEFTGANDEANNIFNMIAEFHPPGKLRWVPPISKLHNGEIILFKFAPDTLIFSRFDPDSPTPNVQQVI